MRPRSSAAANTRAAGGLQPRRVPPSQAPRLLFLEGRKDEGIAAVWRALELNPGSADGRVVYIDMLKSTGRIDDARAALDAWLTQNPDDEWVRQQKESLAQPPG